MSAGTASDTDHDTGADLDVVLAVLRQEAATWDEQAATLGEVARAAERLRLSALQAGVFAVMHDAHGEAVEHVARRCREGEAATSDVATTLRVAADAYERRDADVAEHVAGAF